MKKDNKKALYESIMTSVAREVKKTLNENYSDDRITYYRPKKKVFSDDNFMLVK